MSDSPMRDFLAGSNIDFSPMEVAVLIAAIAYTETSPGRLISPHFASRIAFVQVGAEEVGAAVSKLLFAGELEWVETDKVRGYRMVRYQRWLDLITSFGGRRYARVKARESRERNKV